MGEEGAQEIEPFDLHRMFVGDFDLLLTAEIVVRTGFMYLAALLLVRVIGKRGLGQLSPFEFVIVIALGSAVGDPMFYPEVPLLHGVVVLTVVVALQKLITNVADRNEPFERFIESEPATLVMDGVIDEDVLLREGLARDELLMRLRQAGVRNVGQVQRAYLEPSGQVSVFKFDGVERPGQSTFVEEYRDARRG